MPLDQALMVWVADHRTAWATDLARGLMAVGTQPLPRLAVAVLALALTIALRAWRPVTVAVIAAGVLSELGKHLAHRPRPPAALALVHAGGFSMPSTDAALTAAAASALAIAALPIAAPAGQAGSRWVGRLLAAALLALTLGVGVALVYLGAHWPTDVLAGWSLGGIAGPAGSRLLRPRVPAPERADGG